MKQVFVFLVLAMAMSLQGFSQKKLSEAAVYYDVQVNTGNSTPKAVDMLDGATNIIYIKGASSRADMISSLGTQSTIIDGKTGNVTILKEYGDPKYMINVTPAEWQHINKKYDGVNYFLQNDYKTIAGYKCQRAEGETEDGATFTVYFTRELVPVNNDFLYINKNLPGLAMQYEASHGRTKVIYTVSKIDFSAVPLAKFDLPKAGYRVMSYAEATGGK